jgi:small subunit ribosomal protein S17
MSETPETTENASAGGDREARSAEAGERRTKPSQQPQRGPRTPAERDAERRERRVRLAAQRRRYRAKRKAKLAEAKAAAPAPEPAHAPEHGPGRPKVRQGVVVSDKADKTIVVRIDVTRRHRRYRKILRTSTTLHAHDERNDAHAGDTVRVVESRPLSATKRWRLVDVLERAR